MNTKVILPAPQVPQADSEGSIPIEIEQIAVLVPVWVDAKKGDTYRLLRSGSAVEGDHGVIGAIDDEQPGSMLELTVLASVWFAFGSFTLNYDVTRNDEFLHGSNGIELSRKS